MQKEQSCSLSAITVLVLIVTISAISASNTGDDIIAIIITVNVFVVFVTLVRHGNESGFSKWILSCVDVSPAKGYLWFDTGETPEPEDIDYSDSVSESYPTLTVLAVLLVQSILIYWKVSGAKFSPQAFGLVYDIGGGWVLVTERLRSGPYLTADIQGNAKAYFESIWGFILLGTGFTIQIIAILV